MAYTAADLTDLLAALTGLTAAEKMNVANLIFIETFQEKNLQDTHPFFSQVRAGSKVPILEDNDDYGSFPFTEGNCQLPECSIDDNFSEFTWDIQKIGCKVTICMENFANDFLVLFNTWKKMNEDSAILSENALSVVDEYIDTGSMALNAIVSGKLNGGVPKGRITGLVGPTGSGKTLILNKIVANAQKADPDVWGVVWDTENAYDPQMAINVASSGWR